MAKRRFQGVAGNEENHSLRPIDVRPTTTKIYAWLGSAKNVTLLHWIMIAFAIFLPISTLLTIPLAVLLIAVHKMHALPKRLISRLPASANVPDLSDPKPQRREFHKANGMLLLGYAIEDNLSQIWLHARDLCTHIFQSATTGGGKTFNFLSILANASSCGAGGLYSDAKGDPALAFNGAAILRAVGREDDLFVVSMLTSSRDPTRKSSNSMNPLTGNADSIVQLLSTFAPPTEGANGVFAQQGMALLRGIATVLCHLRDNHGENFGVPQLREAFTLRKMDEWTFDPRVGESGNSLYATLQSAMQYAKPTERGRAENSSPLGMRKPNSNTFSPADWKPHAEQCSNQFQFAAMTFTGGLTELADTYAHVFSGILPEVNWDDVSRNKRFVFTMLPALEKSEATLKTTGQIIVGGMKTAIAKRMGSNAEGPRDDVIESKSASANVPIFLISDEHAQIMVPGVGTIMAQARSLKACTVIGVQTLTLMREKDKAETIQILACSNTFLLGKSQDYEDFEYFQKKAGQIRVASPFDVQRSDSLLGGFKRADTSQLELQNRWEFTDVLNQIEGEAHALINGTPVRLEIWNPQIKPIKELRFNRFLAVGEFTHAVPGQPGSAHEVPVTLPAPTEAITPSPKPSSLTNRFGGIKPQPDPTAIVPSTTVETPAAAVPEQKPAYITAASLGFGDEFPDDDDQELDADETVAAFADTIAKPIPLAAQLIDDIPMAIAALRDLLEQFVPAEPQPTPAEIERQIVASLEVLKLNGPGAH